MSPSPTVRAATPDVIRRDALRASGVRYVLYVNALASLSPDLNYAPVRWPGEPPPSYLKPAYRNADVTLYQVDAP